MSEADLNARLQALTKENNSLKKSLARKQRRSGHRNRPRVSTSRSANALRHLRIDRLQEQALVTRLKGLPLSGPYVRKSGKAKQSMADRVRGLMRKYRFSLSEILNENTGQPYLNVQQNTGQYNQRMFRVVAKEDVPALIRSVYEHPGEGGFRGRDAMYSLLRRVYVGVTRADIESFLRKRPVVQQLKPKKYRVSESVVPKRQRGVWQIDFIEMSTRSHGYRYVCVIVDMFSKYMWAFPLTKRKQNKKKGTKNRPNRDRVMNNIVETKFIDKLRSILEAEDGGPDVMQSDNEFKSKDYLDLMREFNISVQYSMPYSPQTNGGVERLNGTLKKCLLKCMVRYEKGWVLQNGTAGCLPLCVHAYNNHKHRSTGHAPISVHRPEIDHPVEAAMRERLGLPIESREDGDVLEADAGRNLVRHAVRRQDRHLQSRLVHGDMVRVRILPKKPVPKNREKQSKIQRQGGRPRWSEQVYLVDRMVGKNRYTLQFPDGKPLTTRSMYVDGTEKRRTPRRRAYMRHQLQKVEIPSPEEEPFDPLLRNRVQAALRSNEYHEVNTNRPVAPSDAQAARDQNFRVANANQRRIHQDNQRRGRIQTRNTTSREGTHHASGRLRRGHDSSGLLLRMFDDPSSAAVVGAMQEAYGNARRSAEPTSDLDDDDIERVRWELRSIGLSDGGSGESAAKRLLRARPFARMSTPALRMKLATFTLPSARTGQADMPVPMDTSGPRGRLLRRLVRALQSSNITQRQLLQTIRRRKITVPSTRKADLFRAYVDMEADVPPPPVPDPLAPPPPPPPTATATAAREQTATTITTPGRQTTTRLRQHADKMAHIGVWGGETEIKAASELYSRRIVVHSKAMYSRTTNQYFPQTYLPRMSQANSSQTIHLLHLLNMHYRLLVPCNQANSGSTTDPAPYDRSIQGIQFSQYLRTRYNLCEIELGQDGNCLFRCIARALGPNVSHRRVRREVVAHIKHNIPYYEPFISD